MVPAAVVTVEPLRETPYVSVEAEAEAVPLIVTPLPALTEKPERATPPAVEMIETEPEVALNEPPPSRIETASV